MGIERFTLLRKQLERLPMRALVGDAVAANVGEIETMQREQLEQGRGKDGEKIQPSYKSGTYAKKKNARNPEPGLGTPDLKDTGAYHGAITARAYQDAVEISSSDYKAQYLVPKYPNAMGLNVLGIIRLQRELVLPHLQKEIRRLLNP